MKSPNSIIRSLFSSLRYRGNDTAVSKSAEGMSIVKTPLFVMVYPSGPSPANLPTLFSVAKALAVKGRRVFMPIGRTQIEIANGTIHRPARRVI